MIMAPTGSMFPSIIIFLLFCSMLHTVVRGEYQLNLEGISAKQTVCSESKVSGDRWVKIVHAYGPCSPTRQQPPAVEEMLYHDLLRLAHLHERVQPLAVDAANHSTSAVRLGQSVATIYAPVSDSMRLGGSRYMVPILVGTPTKLMHVMIDTSTDLCWIQCKPCIHCYTQEEPIFNPAGSSSLSYVPCTDPGCNHHPIVRSDIDDNGCAGGRCTYQVRYDNGSRSSGFVVSDRVFLAHYVVKQNFLFGCGNNNRGGFNGTAGVFGLGNTPLTLNKQMSPRDNIFSYCLPPTYRDTGYLKFGHHGPFPPGVYTPIVRGPANPSRLYVNLLAMSVDGQLLQVPEGLFVRARTIIDCGTRWSYIPEQAYSALRMAIRNSMSRYRFAPPPAPSVDTCYDLGNATEVDSPTVTFHFTGAELRLGFTQIFFNMPRQEHIYCLGFGAMPTNLMHLPSIVGSLQQRGLEVIFNLGENKIGFSTAITNCH